MIRLAKFFILIVSFTFYSHLVLATPNNSVLYYKVTQKSINLLPLQPLSILGLNTVFIHQHNNQPNNKYAIVLTGKITKSKWRTDVIKINKKITNNPYKDQLLPIPTNLYLKETIVLTALVKNYKSQYAKEVESAQIDNNKTHSSQIIALPYFIILYNKFNNQLYSLKKGKIFVALNKPDANSIQYNLHLKFNAKYIDDLQLLIGFQESQQQFNEVKQLIFLRKPVY